MVGGLVPFLYPLSWLLRRGLGLGEAELLTGATFFYLAHVVNDPHFAVTYILFYKDVRRRSTDDAIPRAQRIRYVVSGFVVPAALISAAVMALVMRSPQTLGVMAQVMYFLVGWHYVKQGFGVLSVLSGREGTRWSPRERTVVLVHAFSAWAFSWVNPSVDAGTYEERGVVYWAPAKPAFLELGLGVVLAISSATLVAMLVGKWQRERTLPYGPLGAFLVTVWLLTIFTWIDPLVRYAIPALHAIQYFYFVGLMKRNEARAEEGPPTFGPPVGTRLLVLAISSLALGWLLFRGAPGALDAWLVPGWHTTSEDLGDTPFLAAFLIVVNIHHYFMDHVIWRRENADTKWLTTDPAPASSTLDPASRA